jgi:hypothetical protein
VYFLASEVGAIICETVDVLEIIPNECNILDKRHSGVRAGYTLHFRVVNKIDVWNSQDDLLTPCDMLRS